MTTQEQRDMLIRHDEQLKAIPDLCESVDKLTLAVQEFKTQRSSSWSVITTVGAIISCVGTWVVLIKYTK